MRKIAAIAATLALSVGPVAMGAAQADAAPSKAAAHKAYNKAYTDGCKRDFEAGYSKRKFHPNKGVSCETWRQAEPQHMSKRAWHRYARSFGAVKIGTVDGHRDCWAKVGPTSHLLCRDGHRATS